MLESICSKCGDVYNPDFLGQLHFVRFETGEQCYGLPILESLGEYR